MNRACQDAEQAGCVHFKPDSVVLKFSIAALLTPVASAAK